MTFEIAKREKWPDRVPLPSITEIKKYVSYDPLTGFFSYKEKKDKMGRVRIFKTTGHTTKRGYRKIRIAGKNYYAHRIAYKISCRDEPYLIDHINGNFSDNRIENLRKATPSQNNFNRRKNAKKYLPKGVRRHLSCNKFEARITIDKKRIYLGLFSSVKEAHAAYISAANKNNKEFARFN